MKRILYVGLPVLALGALACKQEAPKAAPAAAPAAAAAPVKPAEPEVSSEIDASRLTAFAALPPDMAGKAELTEPRPFRFRELERVRDGFFIKLSYLLRR